MHRAGVVQPRAGGERRDGGGVVAGEDLEVDALLPQPHDGLGDVRAQLVGQRDHGQRLGPRQHGPSVAVAQGGVRVRGAGEDEDAEALHRPGGHLRR